MANRIAGLGSDECIWMASEALEPMFHRGFIWRVIGEEASYVLGG